MGNLSSVKTRIRYEYAEEGYDAYKELVARKVLDSGDVDLERLFEVTGNFQHPRTDQQGCSSSEELKKVMLEQAHEEYVGGFLSHAFDEWLGDRYMGRGKHKDDHGAFERLTSR